MKNKSKKVPNGTIIRTRDENFNNTGNYRKSGYQNKGDYRGAIVVDSNRSDEFAVIKMTTSNKGRSIPETKSKFRPYIETKDNNGKPIKEGSKFKIKRDSTGKVKNKISKKAANKIKKDSLRNPTKDQSGKTNREKLRELKGRK